MSSTPVPAPSSLFLGSDKGIGYVGSAGHSRSTSAGSLPSDGQDSADLQKSTLGSPAYPGSNSGLPEYDYPTPWSVERTNELPEVGYPAPLVVKNTFVGFDVLRPSSLAEFFEERRTQSCPASGISLPPGLEDVIEPEKAAANLVAAESALRRNAGIACTPLAHSNIPAGVLGALPGIEAPHFASQPSEQPPLFDADLQPPYAYTPQCHALSSPALPALDAELPWVASPECYTPPPQAPIRLQLSDALPIPQGPERFGVQACAPQEPTWMPPAPAEPVLGSTEVPTIGSQGHHIGTCKPCAFFHTKGCGNGVQCPFCHLCDAGEKKKRSKERREAVRATRRCGY